MSVYGIIRATSWLTRTLTPSLVPRHSFVSTMAGYLALRTRPVLKTAYAVRSLSSTATRWSDESHIPKPPRSIDDSTSALDYKTHVRTRPPPLPAMDLPRSRTAEEAVTNILYNTPPPSLQPFKKCVELGHSAPPKLTGTTLTDTSSTASFRTSLVYSLAYLAFSLEEGSTSTLSSSVAQKFGT